MTEHSSIVSPSSPCVAVICWTRRIKLRADKPHAMSRHAERTGEVGLTLYHEHFMKLQQIAKPPREQLIILLPSCMGFRSGEVSTLRIENIDLESGTVMVEDSKKYKLYPVPITYEVAQNIEKVLLEEKRTSGYLIQQGKYNVRFRGEPLNTMTLCYVWKYWAKKAGIPDWQKYTPTLGRHYFAAWWAHIQKGSLEVLRRIMRHRSLAYTQVYISSLVFYEDVKAEMQRLQNIPNLVSEEGCIHFEVCKFATQGCYCKNYLEQQKVKI